MYNHFHLLTVYWFRSSKLRQPLLEEEAEERTGDEVRYQGILGEL